MRKRNMPPGRFIALSFALVILVGTVLLALPISHQPGIEVKLEDALFTATSAVCVTGLSTLAPGNTFSVFGKVVLGLLIQIGGLGLASIGVGIIALSGKKTNMRERSLIKEALNQGSFKGILQLLKWVFSLTLCIEAAGTVLNMLVFTKDYPFFQALGISAFHAVSAFNNAGFDILGGSDSLMAYANDPLLVLITCLLVICGGLGFVVFRDMSEHRSFRKLRLHTKVVLAMTGGLLLFGTVLLKLTQDIGWLQAFFYSVSTRTAGFALGSLAGFSAASLLVMMVLMFIGASPGSTGGGVKTTTVFVVGKMLVCSAKNKPVNAFKRKIPSEQLNKAMLIVILGFCILLTSAFLLCALEPEVEFLPAMFEVMSALSTTGLTMGITSGLGIGAKLVLVLTMFIGRIGPLTIATLWAYRFTSNVSYAEEQVAIG